MIVVPGGVFMKLRVFHHLFSIFVLLGLMTAACTPDEFREALDVEADEISVNGTTYLRYRSYSLIGVAAAGIQERYPDMKAARKSKYPKFIDSHPAGSGHAELEGFGVTMVKHDGGAVPGADDILYSSGRVNDPTLLFFDKGKAGKYEEWEIIGMGYSMIYRPDDRPVLLTQAVIDPANPTVVPPGDPIPGHVYRFLMHEAGYHNLTNGQFIKATDNDLKKKAKDAGKTIDPLGASIIDHDDLKAGSLTTKRHGRVWTLHVWFEPGTGLPVFAEADPWNRSPGGITIPSSAFVDVDF